MKKLTLVLAILGFAGLLAVNLGCTQKAEEPDGASADETPTDEAMGDGQGGGDPAKPKAGSGDKDANDGDQGNEGGGDQPEHSPENEEHAEEGAEHAAPGGPDQEHADDPGGQPGGQPEGPPEGGDQPGEQTHTPGGGPNEEGRGGGGGGGGGSKTQASSGKAGGAGAAAKPGAKQAAKPKRKRRPVDKAKRAATTLKMAKMFLNKGDKANAEKRLKEIIGKYPGTPAAREAKQLLAK